MPNEVLTSIQKLSESENSKEIFVEPISNASKIREIRNLKKGEKIND